MSDESTKRLQNYRRKGPCEAIIYLSHQGDMCDITRNKHLRADPPDSLSLYQIFWKN